MTRYASLFMRSIMFSAAALFAAVPALLADDVKHAANDDTAKANDSGKREVNVVGKDGIEKFDIGEIDDKPPAELDVDPTLQPSAASEQPKTDKPASRPQPAGSEGISVGRHRKAALARGGGIRQTERAVVAALAWLSNHQSADGSWSLQDYTKQCRDKSCTGPGVEKSDVGATALALLPFLAAGQTHKNKGPYQSRISRGLANLVKGQRPDGSLAQSDPREMYAHGLATIAISEAYGLSGDKELGVKAQKAVDFIVAAQNKNDGGWRYHPGDAGDTCVLGWQLAALKSAKLAGLKVPDDTFKGAGKFLDVVAVDNGSEYTYTPGCGVAETMTAVGLLSRQRLGIKNDSAMLVGGAKYLMRHLPAESHKNIYYYFYATQVMHNMDDYNWDAWNRKMRALLVETQVRDVNACANGSWDAANDQWGHSGGRVMQTALSTLTLEVYYRYLPLFKADATASAK